MDLKLAGRVAVVTGASKGIGLAITRSLLDEGAKVLAVSRGTSSELDAVAGPSLRHTALDLMDPAAPEQAIAEAVSAFGGLDILVNNAGGPPPGVKLPRTSFHDATDEDWRAMFEFNLFSAVRAIRAALPHLATRGGSIINISTTLATQPSPMNVDYGAAKAALNNLTKVLSEEFAPQGIRVNTISPGGVRTPWWTDPGGAADRMAGMLGSTREEVLTTQAPQLLNMLTGRLITPEEIADMVLLLASPRSASTTGTTIPIDAGLLKAV
ncbi:NAD(P)-dependent dehydrogenase (short-subunit alcohol dehydrogenase family) [Actinokineospora baliensis]|uniref:SDR family NAD(P)-dependent oxidoreductase n=1 Tax=Actinokineospora baliensis TaxID=547056 RepID=UPI00195B196E|nr:SDR family oxidoreductase [Actinokineospora baliensis]MBM7773891.1 NAD(P)-dependent dehydrogenase (short-subunit alcohol dehydrogenase family) [Actinokineospora baliensis]